MRAFLFLSFMLPNFLSGARVMLHPAGDEAHPARELLSSYERGVTLQLAEQLGKVLHASYGITPLLTRKAGERVERLAAASFANRAQVNFFVSLHICHGESPRPEVSLYALTYNRLIDGQVRHDANDFIPLHEAHFVSLQSAKNMGERMLACLGEDSCKRLLSCRGIRCLPFRPLVGITRPALGIEIVLSRDDQWQSLVDPLARGIAAALGVSKKGL